MNLISKYFLGILSIILFIHQVYAISSGANEPIADNELGLTAKDCALQYCQEKDGMMLWLSLVNGCVDLPNPYLMKKNIENSSNNCESVYNNVMMFNNLNTGLICSMIGIFGLIFGYVIGTNKTSEYLNLHKMNLNLTHKN